jgi:isopenicillin N synthase-like dioxygenase
LADQSRLHTPFEVAIVDFADYYATCKAQKLACCETLAAAVHTTGFALLKNTKLTTPKTLDKHDDTIAKDALIEAGRFFENCSNKEKQEIATPDGSRGYYQYTNNIPGTIPRHSFKQNPVFVS